MYEPALQLSAQRPGCGYHRRLRLPRQRSSPIATRAATSSPTTRRTGSRRLTFDANGNVTGVFNFEPADGAVDGPYGDIVYLTEGPRALCTTSISATRISAARSASASCGASATSNANHAADRERCGDPDDRRQRRSPSTSRARARPIRKGSPLTYRGTSATARRRPRPTRRTPTTVAGTYSRAVAGVRWRQLLDLRRRSRSDAGNRRPRRSWRRPMALIFSGRRRDHLQRHGDRYRGRHAARERLHLEHRLPARGPRAPRHARNGRDERHSHDPDPGTISAATPAIE